MSISAVVHTFNAEKDLRWCLQTLRWCDEIIVVDMYSKDRTVDIAREFTDRVYFHDPGFYFERVWKFSYQQANGEWILRLDPDEMATPSLARRLREIADKDLAEAVFIPRLNYLLGQAVREAGWWPDSDIRFFKKSSLSFPTEIFIHGRVQPNGRLIQLEPSLDTALMHFHVVSSEEFLDKINRYTSREARACYERGVPFKLNRMFRQVLGDFRHRYIKLRGYRGGFRAFALCLMMAMYWAMVHVKLWELHNGIARTSATDPGYLPERARIVVMWNDAV